MKNTFTLLLVSMIATQALAIDYKPFSTVDSTVEQRSDLRGKLAKQRVPLPTGAEAAFTTLVLPEVRLSLFNEVAAFLTTASQPGPYVSIDMKQPAQQCMTNEAVAREGMPSVKAESSCVAVAQALSNAYVRGFEKACRYVHQPLRFVEDQPPGVMVDKNMQNLEGLIALAGEALTHVRFPDNLITRAKLNQFADIVAKIRTPTMIPALNAAKDRFAKAKTAVAAQPSCVANSVQLIKTLDLLMAESDAALTRLAELDRTGRAQAAADLQKVTASGRKRAVLPYPSLSDNDRETLSFFVGGVYWRMRGGGLVDAPEGTQKTRVVYHKYPSGVIGELNGGSRGKNVGESFYWKVFQGWGQWMDMGRSPGENDRFYDLTYMTDRGLYHVEDAAKTLSNAGYDSTSLLAGGLHMGPVYWYAWEHLDNVKIGEDLRGKLPYEWFLHGATSWGEFAIGASINLGLSRSLLKGTTKKP